MSSPNHSPEVQRKAGFTKELFGGDPNGFLHGLVFDEGKSWQINRKRLSKQLHLGILESYIEVSFKLGLNLCDIYVHHFVDCNVYTDVFQKMDHAANIFVDELVNISDNGFVSDIKVKDRICRFAFDIMLQCLMGDTSDIQTRNRFILYVHMSIVNAIKLISYK